MSCEYVLRVHTVFQSVLSNFTVNEIIPLRNVDTFWRDEIDQQLRSRKRKCKVKYHVFRSNHIFNAIKIPDDSKSISVLPCYKYVKKSKAKRLKQESPFCQRKSCENCTNIRRSFLYWRSLWTEMPELIIVAYKIKRATFDSNTCRSEMTRVKKFLLEYTPPNCKILFVKCNVNAPYSHDELFMQFLFFPSVHCVTFMPPRVIDSMNEEGKILKQIKRFLRKLKNAKLFLFFYQTKLASDYQFDWLNQLLTPLMAEFVSVHKDLVILGCSGVETKFHIERLDKLNAYSSNENYIEELSWGSISAIALCGGNVHAASVLLESSVQTTAELKSKLSLLKTSHSNINTKKKQSFLVMTSSGYRMKNWYVESKQTGIELIACKNSFSNVPILPVYSYGWQIGSNFNIEAPLYESKQNKLVHQRSTIFTIVTLT